MKKLHRLLCAALALTMVITLIGCSSPSGSADKTADKNASGAADTTEKVEDSSEKGADSTEKQASSDKPMPMRFVTPGNMPQDAETGLKAVNEKMQADGYNIELIPVRIPWDAYDQKLNVMLSTGEKFELIHVMQDVKNISSLASRNALLPLDDMLQKYPKLVSLFTDTQWKSGVYQGSKYGVPANWRSFDLAYGTMVARADVMDKFTDGKDPATVEELIDVDKKMQAAIEDEIGKKPYVWTHQIPHAPANLHRTYDTWPFYVELSMGLALVRQDGSLECYYESEEFKKDAQINREMYKSGLIHPDILNTTSQQKYDEFKIGVALPSATFGYGDQVALQENIPSAYVRHFFLAPEKEQLIYTLSQNLNAVSATAENPESGLMFLDWLYKDKANHDLYHYGIEGVHYTATAPNRIKTIKGEDNQDLYSFDYWMTGYYEYRRFDEDYPQEGIEFESIALPESEKVYSPAAGFLFDATSVQAELINLETEIKASMLPIRYGLVEYDEAYPSAIDRLKKAGLDKYMEEYRNQLSKYLQENPDVLK